MKKYLLVSLLALILFIVGLVGYGSYLNYAGEHHLLERMTSQRIPVKGEKVMRRDMKIVHRIPTVTLYSDDMADAKALTKGHIVKFHVRKNP